jgi:hypothetical protein
MKQPKILFVDHTAVLREAELSLYDLAFAYRQLKMGLTVCYFRLKMRSLLVNSFNV